MVEFALVLPVLVLVLFGIIEFGWAFAQFLDVRHAAREGARLAAIDYDSFDGQTTTADQRADVVDGTCEELTFATLNPRVTLGASYLQLGSGSGFNDGAFSGQDWEDYAVVTVQADTRQITGLFSPILNGLTLSSKVRMRMEGTPRWASSTSGPVSNYTGTC